MIPNTSAVRGFRRALRALVVLLVAGLLTVSEGGRALHAAQASTVGPSLAGRLLVAGPGMPDPRFRQTVLLMVDDDSSGSFGIVINRVIGRGSLANLLRGFEIEVENPDPATLDREITLHHGGPVQTERGFIVHSDDFAVEETWTLGGGVAVTPGAEPLRAMAKGEGPRRAIVAIGYAGWDAGQLRSEIDGGDWLDAAMDAEIVFDDDPETLWSRIVEDAGLSL